jgi:hypothetical protein
MLPRNAERIMHLSHFQGQTLTESFHLDKGIMYTCRSLVDNLFVGTLGYTGAMFPWPAPVIVLLVLLFCLAGYWWWLARDRRLLLLGAGCILVSYVLTYSARAEWPYHQLRTWTRYHVFPHLGLVLFICGGLPRWQRWLLQDWTAPAAHWRRFVLCLVLARICELIFIVQMPRSLFSVTGNSQQQRELQRIAAVDARCRELGISAETARQALPPFKLWSCDEEISPWEFLHGSPDPRPISVEQARQLLTDFADPRAWNPP